VISADKFAKSGKVTITTSKQAVRQYNKMAVAFDVLGKEGRDRCIYFLINLAD
jgi:hypothetical protein|tara:strand:+ start:80 stop:238 length:159 start_codon:yes stop_codon:yes gene_type:complete